MARKLLSFDAFNKTVEDAKIKTTSGGLVTIISVLIIFWLTLSEWWDYRSIDYRPELIVDKARGERLTINLNITFPQLSCELLTMDIMDASGEIQEQVSHGITKTRIDKQGKAISSSALTFDERDDKTKDPDYCGPCYGAVPANSDHCCNTCEDIKKAYAQVGWAFHDGSGMEQCENEHYQEKIEQSKNEGCIVAGHVSVNKVVGNFHFAPGASITQSSMHSHDLSLFLQPDMPFTFSHIINHLSFGPEVENAELSNPLDGVAKATETKSFNYQYFVKVVATRYEWFNGKSTETNQYSVTSHERSVHGGRDEDHPHTMHSRGGIPGVFFAYEISPMKVINREQRTKSFGSFLTGICAIVGGVLTVGAVIDRGVWEADKALRRKKSV